LSGWELPLSISSDTSTWLGIPLVKAKLFFTDSLINVEHPEIRMVTGQCERYDERRGVDAMNEGEALDRGRNDWWNRVRRSSAVTAAARTVQAGLALDAVCRKPW